MEHVEHVMAQVPPEHHRMVLVCLAFVLLFMLSLFMGVGAAAVWMSILGLVGWFADAEYHWIQRFVPKEKV